MSLAHHALAALDALPPADPLPRALIALAGPPGCGKTTTGTAVAALINTTLRPAPAGASPTAVVVALDGFHLPRSALAAMPDPAEAFRRRGSPWTFDGAAAVAFVKAARSTATELQAPSFDHAVKDPVVGGTVIPRGARIVLFEGNYLLADEAPWAAAVPAVDARWFLDVDEAHARQRLAARHLAAGIEPNMAAALARCDGNDMPNGRWIREHLVPVDVRVESVEEPQPA